MIPANLFGTQRLASRADEGFIVPLIAAGNKGVLSVIRDFPFNLLSMALMSRCCPLA